MATPTEKSRVPSSTNQGPTGKIVASIELDFPIETTGAPHEESLG